MISNSNVKTQVLVFKTNLKRKKDIKTISNCLSVEPRISTWNVDFHDRDKVLRIESVDIHPDEVIRMVEQSGFSCEELPD